MPRVRHRLGHGAECSKSSRKRILELLNPKSVVTCGAVFSTPPVGMACIYGQFERSLSLGMITFTGAPSQTKVQRLYCQRLFPACALPFVKSCFWFATRLSLPRRCTDSDFRHALRSSHEDVRDL